MASFTLESITMNCGLHVYKGYIWTGHVSRELFGGVNEVANIFP